MYYLFVDESGDLGKNGSKYFVISGLLTKNPKKLDRIIKNMRRNTFRKELAKCGEIKNTKSSRDIKLHMIKNINTIKDIQLFTAVLDKSILFKFNDMENYFMKNKRFVYNYVAGELANQIEIEGSLEVIIDKSMGKLATREEFNNYFIKNLFNSKLHNIKISHSYSHAVKGLQFADLIAGIYFIHYTHKNSFYSNKIEIQNRN